MISFSQFMEKVKNSKPPLLGFSFLYIFGCIDYILTANKNSSELRKPYPLSKSLRSLDVFSTVFGSIVWVIFYGFDTYIEAIILFFIGLIPMKLTEKSLIHCRLKRLHQTAPLIRMLSILEIEPTINNKNPFFSINNYSYISIPIYFSLQIKNEKILLGRVKCGVKDNYNRYKIEREYMIFSIPSSQEKNINDVIEIFKKFLNTTTGKDLSFHYPILEYSYAKSDDRIEILFVLHKGILHAPNFYEDKYFYYNEDDIQQLYNDISDLHYSLENLFE